MAKEKEDSNVEYRVSYAYFPGDNQPGLLQSEHPISEDIYRQIKKQIEAKSEDIMIKISADETEIINRKSRNLFSVRVFKIEAKSGIILANTAMDLKSKKFTKN